VLVELSGRLVIRAAAVRAGLLGVAGDGRAGTNGGDPLRCEPQDMSSTRATAANNDRISSPFE
jgi:hypothetical protein